MALFYDPERVGQGLPGGMWVHNTYWKLNFQGPETNPSERSAEHSWAKSNTRKKVNAALSHHTWMQNRFVRVSTSSWHKVSTCLFHQNNQGGTRIEKITSLIKQCEEVWRWLNWVPILMSSWARHLLQPWHLTGKKMTTWWRLLGSWRQQCSTLLPVQRLAKILPTPGTHICFKNDEQKRFLGWEACHLCDHRQYHHQATCQVVLRFLGHMSVHTWHHCLFIVHLFSFHWIRIIGFRNGSNIETRRFKAPPFDERNIQCYLLPKILVSESYEYRYSVIMPT